MSTMEFDEVAPLPFRLRPQSPSPAVTATFALDHAAAQESTIVVDDAAEGVDAAKDDGEAMAGAAKTYSVEDYFGVQYDDFGQLHIVYACPRPDTQCDGFSFSSIQECLDHERDWHAGLYKCFVCGQVFASRTRLQRHEHYKESQARAGEIEVSDTRKSGCRVYHGNEPARRRARTLAKLVKMEKVESDERRAREATMSLEKNLTKRRKKEVPLLVIGTQDVVAAANEESKHDIQGCEEPCCPYFEKHFTSNAHYQRHILSHGHLVATQMGEALLQQFTTMARANIAALGKTPLQDVEMSGSGSSSSGGSSSQRAHTPPPRSVDAQTQLPSPPPTPHDVEQDPDSDSDGDAWDGREKMPMQLERRLAKTQQALRELRCNAPVCYMHGRKLASSQAYWGHLASEAHVTALKAWSDRGGDIVYL